MRIVAVLALLAAACGNPSPVVENNAPQTAQKKDSVRDDERLYLAKDAPVAGQWIVVLDDAETGLAPGNELAVIGLAEEFAAQYNAKVSHHYAYAVRGFAAAMSERDARRLSKEPLVAFVEQQRTYTVSVVSAQEDEEEVTDANQSDAVWGIDRLDQANLPLDKRYVTANDGEGVKAYVVDTGIRTTHRDFQGRAIDGFTSINDGKGWQDCHGHGTHVAGTVGSRTYGVAKAVTLVPVRVLNCEGSGTDAEVIAGIDWVTKNASGPSVGNMSLGGDASQALDDAVKNSVNAGVTWAVAAGNENQNACNVSPARAPEAITVGATTSSDRRASFSNYGTCVDIFAPGSGIKSLSGSSDTGTATMDGTSMASPHVAGAAALYLSAHPDAKPGEVRDALVNNGGQGKVSSPGSGSPNVLLNVQFIGGGGEPQPEPTPGTPGTFSESFSVQKGGELVYNPLSVKQGSRVRVKISGSGDADLYVRFGAAPTSSSYACRPYTNDSNETCDLEVPAGQTQAFFQIRGYKAASGTVTAEWTAP